MLNRDTEGLCVHKRGSGDQVVKKQKTNAANSLPFLFIKQMRNSFRLT